MQRGKLWVVLLSVVFTACSGLQQKADLILTNGVIYTVDADQPWAEAIAIRGDRILKVGNATDIIALADKEHTQVIDLDGRFVMPGFIEGHGHFSGLGQSLLNLNFMQVKSWDEIVQMVAEKAKTAKPGEWIIGRGWHQEKWTTPLDKSVLGYPYHDALSAAAPNNPVMLGHASGHSLFANAKAMELAGVTAETPNPSGGEIVRDSRGVAIGVFEERAMGVIRSAYQDYLSTLSAEDRKAEWLKGIEKAEEECLKKGVTSFQDAGASFEELDRYRSLAESGQLDLRLWAMIRHSYADMKGKLSGFPWIDLGNHFLTVRGIKSELDGALGSFGAWLLTPYSDKKDFVGQNTTEVSEVANIASLAMENGLQLCVHTIGDRANREALNVFEQTFLKNPAQKDLRWRLEHAQHLDPADIPRFKQLGVIASMQAIHCTSDAPFVVKRLGVERAKKGAYPWRALVDAGAVVTNGTDTPVEDVNPLVSFYAMVTRQRTPEEPAFFPEQALGRDEAVYAYTMACAYAAFEEKEKGSLTQGKLADLVVLSNNLLNCPDQLIPDTEVLLTMVGGKVKYQKKE